MPIKKPTVTYEQARANAAKTTQSPLSEPTIEEPKVSEPTISKVLAREPVNNDQVKPTAKKKAKPNNSVKKAPEPKKPKLVAGGNGKTLPIEAFHPEEGISETFDVFSLEVGADTALQRIISKAFDHLESAFTTTKIDFQREPYKAQTKAVKTTRRISEELWSEAKAVIDPFDMKADREVARQLTKVALTEFFERQ